MPYWTASNSTSNTRFEFGGMLSTARGAVRQLGRNDEPPDAADFHADDPVVEPGMTPPVPTRELQGALFRGRANRAPLVLARRRAEEPHRIVDGHDLPATASAPVPTRVR